MQGDDAAWALVADAALQALTLPDLSDASRRELVQMAQACRAAAGLPPVRSLPEAG